MDEVIRPAKARALQKRKAQSNTTPAAKRKRFLSVLAATCHVGRSAKAAGIATSTAYMMRRTNPAFAAQWQEALTLGYERLESALMAFALDGLDAVEIEPADDVALIEEPKAREERTIASGLPGSGLMAKVSVSNAQFALALLNRHRETVAGTRQGRRIARRATREETNAALERKLDAIAQQSGIKA